jgi:hypothetical protein
MSQRTKDKETALSASKTDDRVNVWLARIVSHEMQPAMKALKTIVDQELPKKTKYVVYADKNDEAVGRVRRSGSDERERKENAQIARLNMRHGYKEVLKAAPHETYHSQREMQAAAQNQTTPVSLERLTAEDRRLLSDSVEEWSADAFARHYMTKISDPGAFMKLYDKEEVRAAIRLYDAIATDENAPLEMIEKLIRLRPYDLKAFKRHMKNVRENMPDDYKDMLPHLIGGASFLIECAFRAENGGTIPELLKEQFTGNNLEFVERLIGKIKKDSKSGGHAVHRLADLLTRPDNLEMMAAIPESAEFAVVAHRK